MKFFVPLVAALAAAVAASPVVEEEFEQLEERGMPKKCDKYAAMIPACALGPITKCTVKAGCPDPTKYKCGCKHQDEITQCATPKVLKKCSPKQAAAAQAATQQLCMCATGM